MGPLHPPKETEAICLKRTLPPMCLGNQLIETILYFLLLITFSSVQYPSIKAFHIVQLQELGSGEGGSPLLARWDALHLPNYLIKTDLQIYLIEFLFYKKAYDLSTPNKED